jgi:hypothetical protein
MPGYPESNRIFNGDFEVDPTGSPFDWRIDRSRPAVRGAEMVFDDRVRHAGRRSLRVAFDGTQNVGEIGVEQAVFLVAGRYRVRAYIRTHEVSTDEGVALRVVYAESPRALDFKTERLRGTNEWTMVEGQFAAPPSGGLVRVSLVRKPSLKFDNLIRGTVWVDEVSISPE